MSKQFDRIQSVYRTRLTISVDCIQFLLSQGLAFHGHDESGSSTNQDNFLQLLKFLANHNEGVNILVLQNAPENNQLNSSDIQKDIVNAIAIEITNDIIDELGDEFFPILVDESHDISEKEQVAIALHYVTKAGLLFSIFL